MHPDTPAPVPYQPTQQPTSSRPQSRTVVVLAVTLGVLLTIWIVGSILLIQFVPDLGELPGGNPSTDPTRTP
jgi:hypothetical protein